MDSLSGLGATLRYFTRQLYDAMQTRDDVSFDEAKSKWDANCVSYREQLQQIRSSLPKSLQEFCDTSLHEVSQKERKQVIKAVKSLPFNEGGASCR